jgi:parallel beta-helix repeat protein
MNDIERRTLIGAAGIGAIAALSKAGPLNPPAGAVASTAKPLSDVEPRIAINATNTPGDADATPSLFKITQPGSYYLTGNITGVAGKHGIQIAASGVTLDLNGFDLAGVPGMGAFDGVSITVFSTSSVSVRNGSVRNWGGDGIDFATSFGTTNSVSDVLAVGNAGSGISVGLATKIVNCTAASNGVGIITSSGSTVSACTAYANDSDGIRVGSGSSVSASVAFSNAGNGILASNGSTVSGCTTRFNTLDGIQVDAQCVVINNVCGNNGNLGGDGAGIRANGADNRIEGNNCTAADIGIRVATAGNFIIRNTCSGNTTNWSIVANNIYGQIIDRTAPASAAVSGNSAVSALGNAEPNANFTY